MLKSFATGHGVSLLAPGLLLVGFLLSGLMFPEIKLGIAGAEREYCVGQWWRAWRGRRHAHDYGAVGSTLGGPSMGQMRMVSVGKHAVGHLYGWELVAG